MMIQNCSSFLYPSIMCKNNIMVKMDETMFLLFFSFREAGNWNLGISFFPDNWTNQGVPVLRNLLAGNCFLFDVFLLVKSDRLKCPEGTRILPITNRKKFCHECFLRTRYYVCNKFNIWPQRKDKFIKFPSTFKGLRRSTQENLSLKSRVEK